MRIADKLIAAATEVLPSGRLSIAHVAVVNDEAENACLEGTFFSRMWNGTRWYVLHFIYKKLFDVSLTFHNFQS